MHRRIVLQQIALGALTLPVMGRAAEQAKTAVLPSENFVRRPLMESVRLSPDGTKLAAIINSGNNSLLVTRAAAGGAIVTVMHTDNLEFLFNWFTWVNSDRLVISLRYPYQRAIPGSMKVVHTMETRLLAADADGANVINVLKSKGLSGSTGWATSQDNVIDWLPDDGKHILLTLPDTDQDHEVSVFKVNVYTGQRQHYHGKRFEVHNWLTDSQHRVRVGIGYSQKSETIVWICDPDGENWRELNRSEAFSESSMTPLGFGLDPNILYVSALHEGLGALHTVDLRDKTPQLKLKLSHPRYDLNGRLIRNGVGEAVGVVSSTPLSSSVHYWDPAFTAWQEQANKALPNRLNFIAHASRDEALCVLISEAPNRPSDFYLCARESGNTRMLSSRYPELQGKPLAIKKHFSFSARDGLKIPGYLSLPPGSAGKNLPLVIFPHGGPQHSDGPEFDYWVAFMADRGYAVLQPNFRGSTGYGKAFMDAGLRRWGLEMQDDLTDAVGELVRTGVADPQRVAIAGASYGGYAALMGVCKTPKLYKGAFAFAPVTDLVELAADAGQFSRREAIRRQIGEASDDKERLQATSPRLLASRIEVPVVLVHGTHDRQAAFDHSVWMADALKEHGKRHQFIKLDRGDHQLSHLPYRRQVFELLESFLLDSVGRAA